MQNETFEIEGKLVVVPSYIIEDLLKDPEFLKIGLGPSKKLIAVFKDNVTFPLYRKLATFKPRSRVVYKDKCPQNLSEDNVLFIPSKKQDPSKKRAGLKGAYYQSRPQIKKWKAVIHVGGKKRALGYFRTEQEAHEAWLAEAKRLGRGHD